MAEHPYTRSEADDVSLSDLIELAQREVAAYQGWTKWLEDYYDPAKSALLDLLCQHGLINDTPRGGDPA